MRVSDVMSRDVEVVGPDATVREAAQKMKALDVGPLPVCDGVRLLGMVTDRDLTVRAAAEGKDPNATPVRDVMTAGVEYCFADDDVREAAGVMAAKQVRRLPVLDRAKNLVGIVSVGDLATEGGAGRGAAAAALKGVSETAAEHRSGLITGLIALVALIVGLLLLAGQGGSGGSGGGGPRPEAG